jgi:[ribosomal protein S5]-alanine N-acetyltransferase
MLILETPRLTIRNFTPQDASALREIILQKEASEYAIYDYAWPTAEDEIRAAVEWFASGDQYLAVCLKENRRLIGYICLTSGEAGSCELGYAFNFDYHGRGFATEGCQAVIDYAFHQLGALKVTAGTAAANGPSLRLLGRLGFQKVGEMTTAFHKRPDGTPITFLGYAFSLARESAK